MCGVCVRGRVVDYGPINREEKNGRGEGRGVDPDIKNKIKFQVLKQVVAGCLH